MANVNTIKTRILNKYDELANYSNFTPLKGEVCIAVIGETTTTNQGLNGDISKKPVVGIKVGDGTNKFNDLPWIQAIAGDVSSFVKGIVDEAKFNQLVNTLITNASLATSADLDKVEEELAALTARVEANEGKIKNVEDAITTGDNSLANLRAAINAVLGDSTNDFNANTVYGAKKYADKQAAAAQAAAEATAESVAAEKANAAEANAKADTLAKYNENKEAIEAIKSNIGTEDIGGSTLTAAIKTLQANIGTSGENSLGTRVDLLEDALGDSNSGLVKDVADLKTADTQIGTRIDGIEDRVEANEGALATAKENFEAIDAYMEANDTAVEEVTTKVTTLIGTNANKSVEEIALAVLTEKLITDDAQESLNTLEEIANWIQSHPEDAAAINNAIKEIKEKLGYTNVGTEEEAAPSTVDSRINEAINTLSGTINEAIEALGSRVKNLEDTRATISSVNDAKAELIGDAEDVSTDNTIYGAKAYADAAAETAKTQAVTAAGTAADAKYELKNVAAGLVEALSTDVDKNAEEIEALGAAMKVMVESDGNTGMVSGVTQNAETGKITVAHRAITSADLDTDDIFVFYCGNASGYDSALATLDEAAQAKYGI